MLPAWQRLPDWPPAEREYVPGAVSPAQCVLSSDWLVTGGLQGVCVPGVTLVGSGPPGGGTVRQTVKLQHMGVGPSWSDAERLC